MSGEVITESEIRARLSRDLPHWTFADGALERRYRTQGFRGALMVVNAVGHLAETAWHHPEISLSFGSVVVRLNTHDAGGVTEKDFALARKIEEVVGWRPAAEGGALEGAPDDPAHAYIIHD